MYPIRHYHFKEVCSTQTVAKRYFDCIRPGYDPSAQWFLFTADRQLKGRGTREKSWHSPKAGNLYATFALFLPKQQKDLLTHFSQVASLSVAEAIESLGLSPTLKWVNDVLIHHKKVCGILCESFSCRLFQDRMVVLIGVGLNVNMSEADCLAIDQPVTSLKIEMQRRLSRKNVLNRVVLHLRKNIACLIKEGFSPFVVKLQSRFEPKTSVVDHDSHC